jgi:hypothetical protein
LKPLPDIVHGEIGRHPLLVAIGIQSDFLALHIEANIIRRIHIWFDPRQFGERRLGSSQVRDWIDDSDTLIHGKLLNELILIWIDDKFTQYYRYCQDVLK